MKRLSTFVALALAFALLALAGCGGGAKSGGNSTYTNPNDNERVSILNNPDDYESGESSPNSDASSSGSSTADSPYKSAASMAKLEGRTFSADDVDLEFTLKDVSDGGNQIKVVFSECQYPLSGIDLGETYTGTLEKIDVANYVNMDGLYVYAIPYMDLWEDGSRHADTFYLEFTFGSKDSRGEFCLSKIGLLGDTLYQK